MNVIRIIQAAVLAPLLSGAALAADLPSRVAPAPAPLPPVFTWSGLYVGVNLGYSVGGVADQQGGRLFAWNDVHPLVVGGPAWNVNGQMRGILGGAQIGYNMQVSPTFVVGLEADIQGGDVRSTLAYAAPNPAPTAANSYGYMAAVQKVDWWGTFRGRLGATPFAPNLLMYITGGLAYGRVKNSLAYVDVNNEHPGLNIWGVNGQSGWKLGWTVGAGLEYAFASMPNLSLKAEYLYVNLGSRTTGVAATWSTLPCCGAAEVVNFNPVLSRATTQFHVIRAGFNYRFGGGAGPVVARY